MHKLFAEEASAIHSLLNILNTSESVMVHVHCFQYQFICIQVRYSNCRTSSVQYKYRNIARDSDIYCNVPNFKRCAGFQVEVAACPGLPRRHTSIDDRWPGESSERLIALLPIPSHTQTLAGSGTKEWELRRCRIPGLLDARYHVQETAE